MSTQHTKGEWTFREQGEANQWCLITADGRWVIAFLQNGELLPPEQLANARLMAAAPKLLAALAGLLDEAVILSDDYLETFRDWPLTATIQGWDKARWLRAAAAAKAATEAIKEATGEAT
jgi:hypothetical protein